jgi:hypothetical protein
MNSSGIKRGLAASAVSALAVAGIPALASSASAAPGDVIQVQSAGTTRNGGDQGAPIVLNTKGVDPTKLDLAGTDLSAGGEDNATQDVTIIGTPTLIPSGTTGDLTPNDGLDQISLRVTVTTPPGGDDVADFVIFEDEAGGTAGAPDLTEPRTQASVETTGVVTAIDVTPATQTSPSGQPSGAYTVTIRDSEGDLTQLTGAETVAVTSNGDATFGGAGASITAAEINDGTADFTATGTATGSQTITATTNGVSDTAVLNVTSSASLTNADIDVVTGADSSNGAPAQDPTYVRIDQSSVRLDIDSNDTADANSTATFVVTGNGVTFDGGKASTTVTTTLDANGVGSVTITPDAGSIQAGDGFTVNGSGISNLDFVFQRAAVSATSVDAPALVYTQVDTPTSATVTVTDQFGNPVEGAQVSATIAGSGVNNTQPRQTTNASGQTTFTFPAGDTQVGDQDTITYTVFQDAATPNGSGIVASDTTTVKYTADGKGPDYQVTLDTLNTEGPTYSPDDVTVVPLTDAVADDKYQGFGAADETAALTIANGENGAPVTVTVDNGALILTGGKTSLEDGKSSVTGVVGDTFQIVGTTAGIVTVTTTSGGRTETAQLTVEAQNDTNSARNVSVSGPAEVESGATQIAYTAVITDAFGNPVSGFPVNALNIQVSGPAQFQDSDAQSNANGELTLNVRVDSGAEGDVTIKVTGLGSQFGAEADRLASYSTSDDAKGLPVSSNVATATTTVKAGDVVVPPTPKKYIGMQLRNDSRGNKDILKVNAKPIAEGLVAKVFVNGKKVAQHTLNQAGNHNFTFKDKNGDKVTTYVVKVAESAKTYAAKNQEKVN